MVRHNTITVKSRFMDTRLIQTPHYHGQFALSLGKESPLTFSLNSTRLIRKLSIVPLVSILTGFDVIYQTRDAEFHHQMKHREES